MKTKSLILLLCCIYNSFFGQDWNQLTDFPGTARDDGTTFTIGNKVYCGTGLQVGWTCTNDFYAFDLLSESWSTIAPMPSAMQRQYTFSCSILGEGYVFGGINDAGDYLNDLWKYNAISNSWLQLTSMPSEGRSGGVSFVLDNKMYVVGGKSLTSAALNETWMYDPALDEWSVMADFPQNGSWRGVAFQYDNKGFVGLGKDNAGQYNLGFYSYDPALNGWNPVVDYTSIGRAYTGAAQIGQFAYLLGGVDSVGTITNTFEKIDLTNFSTLNLTPLPNPPRKGGMAFTSNDAFFITTGVSTANRLTETWKASSILSTPELFIETELLIYPNPSKGDFTISLKHEGLVQLAITDVVGKVIYSQANVNLTTPFLVNLPVGIAGMCFVEVSGEGFKSQQRAVISN